MCVFVCVRARPLVHQTTLHPGIAVVRGSDRDALLLEVAHRRLSDPALSPPHVAAELTADTLTNVLLSLQHRATAAAAARLVLLLVLRRSALLGRVAVDMDEVMEAVAAGVRACACGAVMVLAVEVYRRNPSSRRVPDVIAALHSVCGDADAVEDGVAYRLGDELLQTLLRQHPSLK